MKDFGREAFEHFLELLLRRRGVAQLPLEASVEVWALADKYCAAELKSCVEQRLLQSVREENREARRLCVA